MVVRGNTVRVKLDKLMIATRSKRHYKSMGELVTQAVTRVEAGQPDDVRAANEHMDDVELWLPEFICDWEPHQAR